jgi:MSHA pilin protein MshD
MIARDRQAASERRQATFLAEQLMTEILQCYYKDPASGSGTLGPDTGETSRASYNDVDDYDGLTNSPPKSRDGATLSGYAGWQRKVTVEWVDPANPASHSNTDLGLKRITVKVTPPSGKTVKLMALRSAQGPYEQTPLQTSTYVTWVGVNVQATPQSPTMRTGAHPMNETTSQP